MANNGQLKMKLEVRVDNAVAKGLLRLLPGRASGMLQKVAEEVVDEAKSSMGGGGQWKLFPSHTGQGMHWTAPPGRPPNPDTFQLMQSLEVVQVGQLDFRVQDGVEYGVYQELGTSSGGWNHTGHQARPFLRPAANKVLGGSKMKQMAIEARLFDQ